MSGSPLSDGAHAVKSRTLVLCFDGTANQFDGDNTNVVKVYSLLKKDPDADEQLCYYQPGIGTYLNPGVVSPLFQWAAKVLDEAFALYLDSHVRGGYEFLMQNYRPGDKICMFGFSRGAYTARALAGMLHKIGLLPKDNPEQVPFAYKLYKRTDADSVALAAGFKQTFCRTVQIEFVGVWETVTSVGVIMGRSLPFTTANTTIKTFRQALSLDEHRAKFEPNLYHRPTPDAASVAGNPEHASPVLSSASSTDALKNRNEKANGAKSKRRTAKHKSPKWTRFVQKRPKRPVVFGVEVPEDWPDMSSVDKASLCVTTTEPTSLYRGDEIEGGTDVLEVWFSGCHSDVGGGAVSDDTKLSLSDITLRWMVREVAFAQCGVLFDKDALARANIPESILTDVPTATNPSPSGGSDADPLDANIDALQPIHDQLKIDPLWWLLEIIPTAYSWQDAQGKWHRTWSIHLGRGRRIPDISPNFHVTVKERMEDLALKYTPKAVWKKGTEVYVE